MKIEIPRIVRRLELGDYVEEMKGATIFVWVNPPRSRRLELFEISKQIDWVVEATALATSPVAPAPMPPQADLEPNPFVGLSKETLEAKASEVKARLHAWWSEIWSQGEAETRLTPEDVDQLFTRSADTDPRLLDFLRVGTFRLMGEHLQVQRKN